MGEVHVMLLNGRVDDTYVETAEDFLELARSLRPHQLMRPIPADPTWTVQDAVGQMCHVAEGALLAGNNGWSGFARLNPDELSRRRGRTLTDRLAEWESSLPGLARLIARKQIRSDSLIGDLVVYEQDIRGAIRYPGGRNSRGYAFALHHSIALLGCRIGEAGLPSLQLRTEAGCWRAGFGRPAMTVTAPSFELFRALSGRRSLAQIASFEWDGDPEPYLQLLPRARYTECSPPEKDIVEAA